MAIKADKNKRKIAVLGAGAIGCHIGGRLAAGGADVTFIGRQSTQEVLMANGLTLAHFAGEPVKIAPEQLRFETGPEALAGHDVILVCVKSNATETTAREISDHADKDAVVVSLQNGLSNRELLAESGRKTLGGMVAFNVVGEANGVYTCTTDGDVILEAEAVSGELVRSMKAAGMTAKTTGKIEAVLWGKLCLNLNNALNVLSGVPLRTQLQDRDHRRVMAMCIEELLAVARARGIRPARIAKAPPGLIPFILRLPTPMFERVAASMIRIDPKARTSMWNDLQAGRPPEVDYLNGQVIMEGLKAEVPTPVNQRVVELVKQAFEHGQSPELSGRELMAMVSDVQVGHI